MDISLQGGGGTPTLLGTRSPDSPAIRTTATADFPSVTEHYHQDYQSTIDRAEEQRYGQVYRASASASKDLYPLGDKSFTIYKDSSGQYITRYVSLVDGTVTYYPEPQLVQYHKPDPKPVVQIKA